MGEVPLYPTVFRMDAPYERGSFAGLECAQPSPTGPDHRVRVTPTIGSGGRHCLYQRSQAPTCALQWGV